VESITVDRQTYSFHDFLGYPDKMDNNFAILTGKYYLQLQEYLKYFDFESIYTCSLEELQANTLDIMNEMFEFLGLVKLEDAAIFEFAENTAQEKKVRNPLGDLLAENSLSKLVKKSPIGGVARKIFHSKAFSGLTETQMAKTKITAEVREKITHIIEEDVINFKELTGKDFKQWSI